MKNLVLAVILGLGLSACGQNNAPRTVATDSGIVVVSKSVNEVLSELKLNSEIAEEQLSVLGTPSGTSGEGKVFILETEEFEISDGRFINRLVISLTSELKITRVGIKNNNENRAPTPINVNDKDIITALNLVKKLSAASLAELRRVKEPLEAASSVTLATTYDIEELSRLKDGVELQVTGLELNVEFSRAEVLAGNAFALFYGNVSLFITGFDKVSEFNLISDGDALELRLLNETGELVKSIQLFDENNPLAINL